MVAQNIVNIILKMEDRASQVAQKVDQMVSKVGNTAQKSNNQLAQSAINANKKYESTANSISRVSNAVQKVGNEGVKSFKSLDDATQKAVINVNRLDESTQNTIRYMGTLSDSSRKWFIETHAHAQEAIAKFDALQNETRTWGTTLDFTRSKMQLMGTDITSIQGKIQVVGSSIKTYLGTSWDTAKTKVTVFGDYIKTHLSSALQTVRTKVDNLSNAFNGLGGFIASAIGGLGMASITDMTIGLAMGRERMTALMQATTGSKAATDQLIHGYENLNYKFQEVGGSTEHYFEGLDEMTNHSLVSLDQLGQAMSNFKMATGATNDQLAYAAPLLNDIGQRAILMGKSGDEALTLMQAAATGLNGNFMTLKYNFGVTKEKLEELGWSGAAEDIEGYTDALMKYLNQSGNMNEMMDTTVGHIEQVKKDFRVAGRTVGEMFTPYIDQAALSLHGIYKNCPQVYQGLIMITGGISGFVSIAPMLSPVLLAFDSLAGKGRALLTFFGLLEAEQGALTASTLSNTIAIKANNIAQAARGVVTSGLVTENAALNASVAGLTAEEIGAAAAHAVNSGALGAESVAAATATTANTSLTASLWAMATALLANPITWIVVAVVALAVAVYEVGKAFGWWKDIPTLLSAVWSGIQRMWDAFVNHPDVQAVIKALSEAWNWLVSAVGQVIKAVEDFFDIHINGEFDAVHAIIEGIGIVWQSISFPLRVVISILQFLWGVIGSVASAIQTAQSKFGAFGGFLATMASPILFVYECLKKIVCILLGCSPGIVPALQQVSETFSAVWNTIASFVGGIISTVISYIQPLLDIFMQIVSFMIEMFLPVWNLLSSILTVIWNSVSLLITIFQAFLMGQITLPQMLTMIWTLIQQTFMTILTLIINFVFTWAGQLISSAVNAASGFVNGIITWVSSLPGRFWTYLSQTASNIINAGSQWVSSARQKAGEMVNSAATTVQQLPGKIYTEFTKVPGRIREAIPQAIAAALNFGKEIINGVLNAMGIHSPGIVQNSIVEEFKNTIQKIKDAIKPAGEYAKQVGEAIVDKFGSPELDLQTDDLMPYYDLDANPLENVDLAGMDLSSVSGGLDSAMGMTDDTNTMIGESYDALATMMMTTLQNMVLQDQLAYGQIQSNDLATFQNISTGLNLNLLSMSTNLRTQLTNMLNTHRMAMTSATNTTRQQLAQMLNETMKVTGEMRSAWAVMADSIISAAARIKNEATTYFNQLSITIGTFYKKLQNPSQWGGGPGSSTVHSNRRVGYDPSVGSRITRSVANAMRVENHAPSSITGSKAGKLPLAKGYLEYLNLTPSSRVSVNDLIQSGAIKEEYLGLLSGFSGWGDVAPANVNYIKSIARNWSMKGPQIPTGAGTVDTGMAFKVSEFENGTPKISFDTFEKIARALFTTVPYPAQMYFTSDRYGSWQNALAHGEMNCWDGTNCLLALANTCGFSGYMARGTWNGIAHVFPIINGKKMDTTSMQNRGNWEGVAAGNVQINLPKVIGKSTPRRDTWNPFKGLFGGDDSGEEIVNDVTHESTVEEINVNLNHNVNVTVDGNVESVDTDALIAELTASVTDKRLIDRIADALIKRDRRIARMGGA